VEDEGKDGGVKRYEELTNTGRARRLRVTAMRAAAEYGLDVCELRQLTVHANYIFRLTTSDGERFALRVQRPGLHQPIDTELELWWVQQLSARGLPVAAVVPNLADEVVTVIDGTAEVPDSQRCVLFEWLPGSAADQDVPGFWRQLGSLAARLHDHSCGLDVPSRFRRRRWDSVFPYEPPVLFDARHAAVITAERSRVLRRGIERLDAELAGFYAPDAKVQLVHGDLHDGNVRRQRDRDAGLTVFDFEDLIEGLPIHDLAVALYGPFFNSDRFAEVVAEMRSGYERHRPWPVEDIDQLRPLFVARALGLVNFCLGMGPEYHDFVGILTGRVERYVSGRRDG
jgi:Ser/Thr protein kinase RdoA (MazF antagonist)